MKPAVVVGGTVSGLAGPGLVLQLDSRDDLAIDADGTFAFPTVVALGATYNVTVSAQPTSPVQTCVVANGSGIVASDHPITDIAVTCVTDAFTISGTVSGLSGTGLVLQNNNTDDLAIAGNGPFTFSQPLASGTAFAVTVSTQPSGPSQTCTVSGGAGTISSAAVTTVVVDCAADQFTVGGIASGLDGSVVLQNNGGDDITVTANGSFAFPSTLASGATYEVTVATHPTMPSQTCIVTSGTGTVTNADITSVRLDCATNMFRIRGTVDGLDGQGLVLQNNGGDNLAIDADGSFVFATAVASGATYDVTVLAQPTEPMQHCAVEQGTGTVGGADVTDVHITCTTSQFQIGGTVTGLAGSGLVVQNSGGDDLAIAANGAFTFATPVDSGAPFEVTILTQPSSPTQTCTVSGGTGTVGAADVTSITINCTTNTYTIGGTVTGLAGTLVLQNNAGDDLAITSNGTFAFATPIESGSSHAVTVLAHPSTPSQTCTVTNGTGTVTSSNVTNVSIACVTNRYTIGGSVSGLAGNGLVLQNNTGDDLAITSNGTFTFTTSIESGSTYDVTVLAQPTNLSQTCTVGSGTGVVGGAAVTDVTITCTTNSYVIGGTVSGLAGTGLVLRNNGGDALSVSANGTFEFAARIPSGGAYAVSVFGQPTSPWQTCVVTNGSGTVTNTSITSVTISCTTNTYEVGGIVSGLAGSGLVLQNNGTGDLAVNADGSFTFAIPVASGSAFAVTVLTQPSGPTQTCLVTGGSGTVGGADVTSVMIDCSTDRFTISGTISGLVGTVVLQNNGDDDTSVTANGTFSFTTTIPSGSPYAVTVITQPTSPWQTCLVSAGSGTVANANITDVVVTCTTNRYTIGGTLSGLAASSSVVLRNNNADDLTITVNGNFTFTTSIPSGSPFSVTVQTHPSSPISQTCSVTNGSGTVQGTNITSVGVTCITNKFTVGGSVSGLTGTGLVLRNSGGDDLSITGNGTFTFSMPVASGATYAVTVQTHPTGQACFVTNGNGTVGSSNVTNVSVTCSNTAPGCGPPTGTFHWKLVEAAACNAWCGGSGQWPCFPNGNTFLCDSAHVGGWLWMYSSSPTPPPNPSTSNNYGWVTTRCGSTGCFTQPGASVGGSCTSSGSGTVFQCCP